MSRRSKATITTSSGSPSPWSVSCWPSLVSPSPTCSSRTGARCRSVLEVTEVRRDRVLQSGYRLCYLDAGPVDGEPIVLLHGLMSDSSTWEPAIGPLAKHGLRVIAPDLIGHGKSDKPRVRYGLDFFATSVSELLTALGMAGATVAGHSLGGAIAVYFGRFHAAQLHRLVLVSSGGLGREVHPILRVATVPGANHIVRAMVNERT